MTNIKGSQKQQESLENKAIQHIEYRLTALEKMMHVQDKSLTSTAIREAYCDVENALIEMESISGKAMVMNILNGFSDNVLSCAVNLSDYSLGDVIPDFLTSEHIIKLIAQHEKNNLDLGHLFLCTLFKDRVLDENRLTEILEDISINDPAIQALCQWFMRLPFQDVESLMEQMKNHENAWRGDTAFKMDEMGFVVLSSIFHVDEDFFYGVILDRLINNVTGFKWNTATSLNPENLDDEPMPFSPVTVTESEEKDKQKGDWL